MFQITIEVPINVIRMVFVFDKRAIRENLGDPDLPQLADQNRQIVDEISPTISIPMSRPRSLIWSKNQS